MKLQYLKSQYLSKRYLIAVVQGWGAWYLQQIMKDNGDGEVA
jgi:hypothetical protein